MKKLYNKSILVIIIFSLSISVVNFGRNAKNAIDSRSLTSADAASIPLVYGPMYLPFTIDPQDCWDSASQNVLIQVVETLFTYDYSNPALPIVPLLAATMGTWDGTHTQFTVDLRTGITFHDGSAFDAGDVVFTFERQEWLYNFTGLNTGYIPHVKELYTFPDHTPIINDVVKVDNDTVRFELNGVYGPFEDLLCYVASSILTDTYYNKTGYIFDILGDIVGTGPFVYDSFDMEPYQVTMHAFDNYWRGRAHIDELVFSGIIDEIERNGALITGDIHFLQDPIPELLNTFKSLPDLTVIDTVYNSHRIDFLGMNNVLINRTWREAISYAIDYSYIIDEIYSGAAVRLKSPLPFGLKYANWTFNVPDYNVTHARQVMQSMGFGAGWNSSYNPDDPYSNADEINWEVASFRTLNYTFSYTNDIQEAIFSHSKWRLNLIGIEVTGVATAWSNILEIFHESHGHTRDELELYFYHDASIYNDPSYYINEIFTNRSVASNTAQYNGYTEANASGRDPYNINDNVQLLMEQALITPDGSAREAMYDRIQELLIEDFALAWAYSPKLIHAHHVGLTGFQQNFFNLVYFYPCQWNPLKNLEVELKESTFSTKAFNLTFSVYNDTGHAITNATFQMWWNGTNVSSDVQNLGGGSYFVSLEPITVDPGDDPILLNMTVSASGYEDKQFETYIAVDPETLRKGAPGGEFPYLILIIVIISAIGGLGVVIITLVILRKRKLTT